jgi:hypothetical protein
LTMRATWLRHMAVRTVSRIVTVATVPGGPLGRLAVR